MKALTATLTAAAAAVSILSWMPAPAAASEGQIAVSEALEAYRAGRRTTAGQLATAGGPVAADIITWLTLREGRGSVDEAAAFLTRRPDWPGLGLLRQRMEDGLPSAVGDRGTAELVMAFFGEATPRTSQGIVAKVEALRQLGRDDAALILAAGAWAEQPMTSSAEAALLSLYPEALGAIDQERAEAMFWSRAPQSLGRAVSRLDGPAAEVGRARLAALDGGAIAGLRQAHPDDPGLAYEAFRRHVAANRDESAVQVALSQGDDVGDGAAWGRARRDLVRPLMRSGEHQTAYDLAASNGMASGSDYADLEWLAGYIALRFLDRPEDALAHFRNHGAAVSSPISLGRAGYWTGRAQEALGQTEAAEAAYAEGARWQTGFYGLLSAEKLGRDFDEGLIQGPDYPALSDSGFAGSSVLEAALLLQGAGERDLAERFFVHLSESLTEAEAGTLSDLILDLGEPHVAVRVAKAVASRGIVLPRAYYPVVAFGIGELPVDEALALAVARRESEFDPGVSSGVGARGLMQLMPGTARDVTRELGLPYDGVRLFADPSYNATLGSAYLEGLIDRFGPSPVLVSAGYNAGPGRPLTWMRDRGDPRTDEVDVIDWIEMIPFTETRNYAMRVAESLPVYRARISGQTAPLSLSQDLKGR